MLATIRFYDIALAIHIMAVVIAFGVAFAYPVVLPYVERNHPRALPAAFGITVKVARLITAPAAVVALIAGIYLASKAHVWSKDWVSVPLLILVVYMGLSGAILIPRGLRAEASAKADVERAGHGDPVWSAETLAPRAFLAKVGWASNILILVAIFFMAAKP